MTLPADEKRIPTEIIIEPAKNGERTLRYGDLYLHSRYDPTKEARRFVDSLGLTEGDLLVLAGVGLGYAAREALARGARVLGVEADPAVKRAADLEERPSRLRVVTAGEAEARGFDGAFRELFDILSTGRVKISAGPSFPKEWGGALDWSRERTNRNLDAVTNHAKTTSAFGRMWVRNILENIPAVIESGSIAAWENRLRGRPGCVLSAGPSLEADLIILKRETEARRGLCIIATDTAFPAALRAGVVPDLVLSIDPQEYSRRHFELCPSDAPPVPLLLDGISDPGVRAAHNGPAVFFSTDHPLLRELDLFPEAALIREGGGSVATVAYRILRRLGSDPVLLIGQDLAMTDGRMYARGTCPGEGWNDSAGRFATEEVRRRREMKERNLRWVESNADGKRVSTTPALDEYRRAFERMIAEENARGHVTIHTAPQGARIEGARFMPLDEWIGRGEYPKGLKPVGDLLQGAGRSAIKREAVLSRLEMIHQHVKMAASPADPLLEPLILARLFPAIRQMDPAERQEALALALNEAKSEFISQLEAVREQVGKK